MRGGTANRGHDGKRMNGRHGESAKRSKQVERRSEVNGGAITTKWENTIEGEAKGGEEWNEQ